jgi:hypothetical protein
MEGASRADWPDFPFCSRRCRTIDLGRWLGEEYRLPAEDGSDLAEDDRRTDDDIP